MVRMIGSLGNNYYGGGGGGYFTRGSQYFTPTLAEMRPNANPAENIAHNFNTVQQNRLGEQQFGADLQMQQQKEMFDMGEFERQAGRDEAQKDRDLRLLLAQLEADAAASSRNSDRNFQRDSLRFSGANSVLNNILGKNYIDQNQHAQATGRYDQMGKNIDAHRATLQGIQGRGLYNDDELAKVSGALNQAFGNASDLARTGGTDHNYDSGTAGIQDNMNWLAGVRNRGKYTADEAEGIKANALAETQGMYQNAAANTYNAHNVGGSPFAAASLLSKGASEGGRARAAAHAGITREQADSRMDAAKSGGQLGAALGGLSLERGRNKLSGAGLQAQVANAIKSLYGEHAGGRMQASQMLSQLLGLEGNRAGALADLDTRTLPEHVRKALDEANRDRSNISMEWESQRDSQDRNVGGNYGGDPSGLGRTWTPGSTTSTVFKNKRGGTVKRRQTMVGGWSKPAGGYTTRRLG